MTSLGPEAASSGRANGVERSFELQSHGGAKLVLRASDSGWPLAELEAEGLRAECEFRAGAEFGLATFLEALRAPP